MQTPEILSFTAIKQMTSGRVSLGSAKQIHSLYRVGDLEMPSQTGHGIVMTEATP